MTTNIYDLTNLLREVREVFQAQVIEAAEKKKQELEILNSDYKWGTKTYEEKQRQIENDYDVAFVRAQQKAAEKAAAAIEDLRQWELSTVSRVNPESMQIINAIRNIPLTQTELQTVLDKHGKNNYWVQRAVASLAEENGIPIAYLDIDSSIDTKLSVLAQCETQLEKMLTHFTTDSRILGRDKEAKNARWLYLSDSILNNAIEIYTNKKQEITGLDAAARAYVKIHATSSQLQKAALISNSLRNLKSQDAKNALLYQLSGDKDISSAVFEIAGISDEMAAWRNGGKAKRYSQAKKMIEGMRTEPDTEKIKENLRLYMADVDNGRKEENEFIGNALTKAYKKNSSIGKALSEMTDLERKTLLGRETELAQSGDSVTE